MPMGVQILPDEHSKHLARHRQPRFGPFFGDDREDAVKNSVMPECPRCHGSGSLSILERINRRFIDRLVSVIWPRHRYHCRSMGCGWEGNLPVERVPLLSGHSR